MEETQGEKVEGREGKRVALWLLTVPTCPQAGTAASCMSNLSVTPPPLTKCLFYGFYGSLRLNAHLNPMSLSIGPRPHVRSVDPIPDYHAQTPGLSPTTSLDTSLPFQAE